MTGWTILKALALICVVMCAQSHASRSWLKKYSPYKKSYGPLGGLINALLGPGKYSSRYLVDDGHEMRKYLPDGSYLIPLENLILDLAGYTGFKLGQVPDIMRGIKHAHYIGEHTGDRLFHDILRRYGFSYNGMGLAGKQGVNDIFNSLGLGGATSGVGDIFSAGPGVSSLQNPLPVGIKDDLFDDYDNGVIGAGLLV